MWLDESFEFLQTQIVIRVTFDFFFPWVMRWSCLFLWSWFWLDIEWKLGPRLQVRGWVSFRLLVMFSLSLSWLCITKSEKRPFTILWDDAAAPSCVGRRRRCLLLLLRLLLFGRFLRFPHAAGRRGPNLGDGLPQEASAVLGSVSVGLLRGLHAHLDVAVAVHVVTVFGA